MSTAALPGVGVDEQRELEDGVRAARASELSRASRSVNGAKVIWAPLPGSQEAFLQCPLFEVLYHGSRGGGKTDCLLMSYAQHVGRGHGPAWRGILFRQSHPQLADVIAKSQEWFPRIFPGAHFNMSRTEWKFPDGEMLLFRHIAQPADYWCVPDGDVLTERGWAPIEDVRVGERALTCDLETMRVELLPVRERPAFDYDGDIVEYEGRGRFMSFTPNHRLVTADRELVPYCELPREASICRGGWSVQREGIESFDIPAVETRIPCGQPTSMSGDDYCEFMGWYLAEGSTVKTPDRTGRLSNIISIAQKKTDRRAKIAALLDRVGIGHRATDTQFVWSSKRWATWLREYGGFQQKFIPRNIIESASAAQLRQFLDAFIDGDGTRQGDRLYAFTSSPGLRDGICEVGVLLGYAPHVLVRHRDERQVSYQISLNPRSSHRLYTDNRERNIRENSAKTQVTRRHHKGRVYCLSFARNHTFFIRQRGSVWLSGNSYHGHELPWIGFEELTNWNTDECYTRMFSCSRSSRSGMPRMVRATTNP